MLVTRVRTTLLCGLLALTAAARAQGQAAASPPQLNFSGVLYGNYQYRTDDAARGMNRFDLERAYLNFRLPAGDRTSIRVTTDVFQQQTTGNDAYYRGWSVRAKYAYVQHDFLKGKEWSGYGRLGMINTVVIEHVENFWPRWLSQVAIERAGFFQSADLGVSTQIGLPNKLGEVMAVISNGPGYTSRETDRFKDYAARVTLTPLAKSPSELLKSLTVSAWGYKGALGSRFAVPVPGSAGTINESLQRDRYGIFAAVKDPRLTVGAEIAQRMDEGETGANSVASPRVVTDSTGRVTSAFVVARPFQMMNPSSTSPLSLVARRDWVTLNTDADRGYDVTIVGLLWDLSKRTTFALDYQVLLPAERTAVPAVKTLFVHYVASF